MAQAAIFGCAGPALTAAEADFFRAADPLGFILFARNIEHPDQIRRLTAALRASVGREDAPILIDQEGGRVARLKPPHWRLPPPAARFGALALRDERQAARAVYLNHRLIAADLAALGIDVDCAPLIDLRLPGAHDVIGDRAYGEDPGIVARLGREAATALLEGGVTPILKHVPGHGRALSDSHLDLPRVAASRRHLAESDFLPFRLLSDMPWAMTAHIVYAAVDATLPATLSKHVIAEVIRGEIGFDGVLISDDLSMRALQGGLDSLARDALAAGCDLVLHCNGRLEEMRLVSQGVGALSAAAAARLAKGRAMLNAPLAIDAAAVAAELASLLGQA